MLEMFKQKVTTQDSLQDVEAQWQKIAAILLWKVAGDCVVTITLDDILRCAAEHAPDGPCMFTQDVKGTLEFSVMTVKEAQRRIAANG